MVNKTILVVPDVLAYEATEQCMGFLHALKEQEIAVRLPLQRLEDKKPFEGAIAAESVAASTLYPAEDQHQDYYQKIPCVINTTAVAAAEISVWNR